MSILQYSKWFSGCPGLSRFITHFAWFLVLDLYIDLNWPGKVSECLGCSFSFPPSQISPGKESNTGVPSSPLVRALREFVERGTWEREPVLCSMSGGEPRFLFGRYWSIWMIFDVTNAVDDNGSYTQRCAPYSQGWSTWWHSFGSRSGPLLRCLSLSHTSDLTRLDACFGPSSFGVSCSRRFGRIVSFWCFRVVRDLTRKFL